MSFLAPAMFWFTLLLPGIVLLYLLKLKRKELVVSSLLLWRKSIDDMKANAPFQRLRNNLLLWLQLLVLALLIMAIVRPILKMQGLEGQEVILLVDTSASMKATDVEPNRMELAKKAAIEAIDDLSRGDSMMIITFGGKTSVRTTMTSDRGLLRRSVEGIEATDERTHIKDALTIASSVARNSPSAEVLILSDGQIEDLEDVPSVPSKVTFAAVGTRGRNVAVTLFDVKKPLDGRARYSAFARVENFGAEPIETVLKLSNNDILTEAKELVLKPGEALPVGFEDLRLNEGIVSVEVDAQDDLPADNRASCVLMAQSQINVLLVAAENYFLEKALVLEREVSLTKASPQSFTSPEGYDVVIFDGWSPETLPNGHFLFFGVPPPSEGIASVGEVDAPIVLDWERGHPLARYVTFAGMNVSKTMQLSLSKGAKPLVEAKSTALIATLSSGRKRIIVVGFDVYKSDWPLRVSFPLFISNAVHWLADRRSGVVTESFRTGDAVAVPTSKSAESAQVITPDGKTTAVELDVMKTAYFSETEQVGVYRLKVKDEESTQKPIAVNLMSAEESNTAPAKSVEIGARKIVGTIEGVRTNREIWHYFAAFAVVFLLVEWFFYSRRAWL